MKISFTAILFLLLLMGVSCQSRKEQDNPGKPLLTNILPSPFSDKGAWFCISLPDNQVLGLGIPLVLSDSNGYVMGKNFILLSTDQDKTKPLTVESYTQPGRIVQEAENDEVRIKLVSVFSDRNTVLLSCTYTNKKYTPVSLAMTWDLSRFDSIEEERRVFYHLGNAILSVEFEQEYENRGNRFFRTVLLKPKERQTEYIAITHHFVKDGLPGEVDFTKAEKEFKENKISWEAYLDAYASLDLPERVLAAKCIQTLITNWRGAAGALQHDGLFPSYAYKGFHGFWAWDSWKHAVALAPFAPELAKNQIRAMYDYQNERGMIADCIFRDTLQEAVNWRNTKPPLSGWAIYEVYRSTGDTAFVKEMLPKLIKYHAWWYRDRDPDGNGLCAYGSTDGTIVAAAWESGMDNAVRFDDTKLFKVNEKAWAFDQELI